MGESLNDSPMVGVSGFEPEASWTRTKRDTKLRHTPLALLLYGETCLLSSENVMDYLRHCNAGLPCQLRGCTLLPMVAELRQRIHSKGKFVTSAKGRGVTLQIEDDQLRCFTQHSR